MIFRSAAFVAASTFAIVFYDHTCATAAALSSNAFNHQYNGNVAPLPNYVQIGAFGTAPSSDGDILTYRVPAGGGYWQASNWSVTHATGFTLEIRAKIDNDFAEAAKGTIAVYFGDGSAGDVLSVGKTSVWAGVGALQIDHQANTDDYHTFRIAQSGGTPTPIRFWRDDVLLHTWPNGGNWATNVLYFGSAGSAFGGPTVHLDYLRWDNTGAYSPAILGDFNEDTQVDAYDIDLLRIAINASSTDPIYNVDGLGGLNSADFSYLVQTVLGTALGDANLDRLVDAADLALVRRNFGRTGLGWSDGKFALAGSSVDANDLASVRSNYGFVGSTSALTIPEAGTFFLLMSGLATAALARFARHRRRPSRRGRRHVPRAQPEQLEPRLALTGTLPSTILFQDGYSDVFQSEFTADLIENFTVIGGNTANAALVNQLRAQGKLFTYSVAYNSSLTIQQLVDLWSGPFNNTLGGALAGGFDGIEIDEVLPWANGSADSNKFIAALSQLRAQYPNKIIAVYTAAPPTAGYSNLWSAISTNADLNLYEAYLRESNPNFASLTQAAADLNAVSPGILNKTIFPLFSAQAGDPGDGATSIGFWGYLDEQMHTLRNDALAAQMPGVGSYVYSQQATTDYLGQMMQHYYVAGRTDYFGDGDIAQDIANPSFEGNTSGWTLTPGAGGSVARVSYSGTGVPTTHDVYGQTSHGGFALKTVRGSAGNQASYSLTINPDFTYVVSAFVTATSGSASNAKIKIMTDSGQLIAEKRVAEVSQLSNVEPWKRIYFTFSVAPGLGNIKIVLTDEDTAAGTTLYWDFIEGEDGAPAPEVGSIQLNLVHAQTYTDATLSTPLGPQPLNQAQPPQYVQRFDVRMSVNGLRSNSDFWLASFDLLLGTGLTNVLGWTPASGSFDSNGAAGGGVQSHWQYGNGDFGSSSTDLKAILVEAAPAEALNRQYGELPRPAAGDLDQLGYPTLLGSIYVQWNGSTTTLTLVPSTGPTGSPWGTHHDNSTGQGTATALAYGSFSGSSIAFVAPPNVPGDFDSDGDVDGADFVAWQTHFPTASGGTRATGDADSDGDVDGADFVVWQTHFPYTPAPGSEAESSGDAGSEPSGAPDGSAAASASSTFPSPAANNASSIRRNPIDSQEQTLKSALLLPAAWRQAAGRDSFFAEYRAVRSRHPISIEQETATADFHDVIDAVMETESISRERLDRLGPKKAKLRTIALMGGASTDGPRPVLSSPTACR